MTLTEILNTPRKIKYVNNTHFDLSMFEKEIDFAIFNNSTDLPEEVSDLIKLTYVRISDTEQRAIISWV